MSQPRLYLLDIEGTVAPLSLVTEKLFPYARAHFEPFLRAHAANERQDLSEGGVSWDLRMLRLENEAEQDPSAPHILPDSVYEPGFTGDRNSISMSPAVAIPRILVYIYWLMDRDRKSTALKSLQGKIWKAGFEAGELTGKLFADVPNALFRWSAWSKVAIYSSGSVDAQQLLFRYSNYGDLTSHITGYFDTRTGQKAASASYAAIAAAMSVAPGDSIFFSDAVRELDAAREAGFDTRLVVRAGNAPVEDVHGHTRISSFDGI
jgi:enolase-phosphatase E1